MKEKLSDIVDKIGKRKLLFIALFLIVVLVILFGGAFIYNKLFYKKSYTEIEEIMITAAENYLEKNPSNAPANINDTISLSDTDLVAAGEMNTISEYLKDDDTSCTGNVQITNINGNNRYVAYLDCGTSYQTINFIDYINSNVTITESGNGLYSMNDSLVYRGDSVDNYLTFSGHTYRIVKFVDNQAVIILTEKTESVVWDNRYNISKDSSVGINDYSVSRIKEYLDDLFEGTSLISDSDKLLVTAHDLNVGKRKSNNTDKTGSTESATVIEDQYIGLLQLSDFLNASIDGDCTTSISDSCVNYNYLAGYNYNWWTITATSGNTYQVYRINGDGPASLTSASNKAYIRPVLYLTKDAIYVSGDGTKSNPYVVK